MREEARMGGKRGLFALEVAALVMACAGIAVWSWPAAMVVLGVVVIVACEVRG